MQLGTTEKIQLHIQITNMQLGREKKNMQLHIHVTNMQLGSKGTNSVAHKTSLR